jgi:hypothetical protein
LLWVVGELKAKRDLEWRILTRWCRNGNHGMWPVNRDESPVSSLHTGLERTSIKMTSESPLVRPHSRTLESFLKHEVKRSRAVVIGKHPHVPRQVWLFGGALHLQGVFRLIMLTEVEAFVLGSSAVVN